jgi:Tol biopolymer transport system component
MSKVSMRRLAGIAAGTVLAIGSATSLAAGANAGVAETTRVSVSSAEHQTNAESEFPSISAHGRFVAFESKATTLVRSDTNTRRDIFVRDRKTGRTERVSISSTGRQADGASYAASISADGRFVAFYSHAKNLVSDDTNGRPDVFVHSRETGRTKRVSVGPRGRQANGHSYFPSISADGRFVAFESRASNLVRRDTNDDFDVFVRDRTRGKTMRVSVTSAGKQVGGGYWGSRAPSISASGRFVAFDSSSSFVEADPNTAADVYVHDRRTGETELASLRPGGDRAIGGAFPSISADGRRVALTSRCLCPDQYNDVLLHNRRTGGTSYVSVSSTGERGDGTSLLSSISSSGRFIAFSSYATNLVPGDTNGSYDAFVHDRATGETARVSVGNGGDQVNPPSYSAAISADGRFVAFVSVSGSLVDGDTNRRSDIFVRGPLR